MGASPDGRIVVNTSETTSMSMPIDAASLELIDNILVRYSPSCRTDLCRTAQIWVSSELRGTVEVFDADTRDPWRRSPFSKKYPAFHANYRTGSRHPTDSSIDRGLMSPWVPPIASPRSMRRASRCCVLIWWGSVSGTLRSRRTISDFIRPTAIGAMFPSIDL